MESAAASFRKTISEGQENPESLPGDERRTEILFMLLPGFSFMQIGITIDAFRMLNRVSGRSIYNWEIVSLDGEPVEASSGVVLSADSALNDAIKRSRRVLPFGIFLLGPLDPTPCRHAELLGWIAELNGEGVRICAAGASPLILAEAGVLEGKNFVAYWDLLHTVAARFPGLRVRNELCCVDGNILTGAGGTACMELIAQMISGHHDEQTIQLLCSHFLIDRLRPVSFPQRMPAALGASSPVVAEALRIMAANVATPLSVAELAGRLGVSTRRLERCFKHDFGTTPGQYYLRLRLNRARQLAHEMPMTVRELSRATGFVSSSYFSKQYRRVYGAKPMVSRRKIPATGGAKS